MCAYLVTPGPSADGDGPLDGTSLDLAWQRFRQAAPEEVDEAGKRLLELIAAEADDLQSHIIDINFADKEVAVEERRGLPDCLRQLLQTADVLARLCQSLCEDGTVAKDLGEACSRLHAESQAIQRELELLLEMQEIVPHHKHVASTSLTSTTDAVRDMDFDAVFRAIAMHFGIPCAMRNRSGYMATNETCYEDTWWMGKPDSSSAPSTSCTRESSVNHPPSATLARVGSRSCLRQAGSCGSLQSPTSPKVVRFSFEAS